MRGALGGWSDGADFGDGTGGSSFGGGVLESSAEYMMCDAIWKYGREYQWFIN
jgi:hypothetical protein